MPSTPTLGLPYPAPSDTADVPRDMQALALALDGSSAMLPVGAIWLWPVANPPALCLICNGQQVLAAEYPKLAGLLGAAGGLVTVPDLRDRVPVGASATKALGSQGGAELVTLAINQIPVHSHGPGGYVTNNTRTTHEGGVQHHHGFQGYYLPRHTAGAIPIGGVAVNVGSQYSVPYAAHGGGGTWTAIGETGGVSQSLDHSHAMPSTNVQGSSANSGSGDAHSNLQPYLSLNYVIRAG
jgi:microcystin-dependent protein